jgi:Leucine-rich repeat (LRR) protein
LSLCITLYKTLFFYQCIETQSSFAFLRKRKLTVLNLSHSKFSVIVEEGNISVSTPLFGLDELGLAHCNITKLPSILTHLDSMVSLDLSCNTITGDIPKFIWERWNHSLLQLNLSHNMFTGMQLNSYVLPFSRSLEVLDLSSNGLQGQVPMPNSSAEYLDYSHNIFSSVLPNFTLYLSDTNYFRMSNNSINGIYQIQCVIPCWMSLTCHTTTSAGQFRPV